MDLNQNKRDFLDPEFASLLLESMADGVFTLDSEGKITLWNRALEKISGYSAGEVLGKSCEILDFNLCMNKGCTAGLEECGVVKYGRVDSVECKIRHKEGFIVPVLKNARVVKDDQGNFKGVVETVTDLTELKNSRDVINDIQLKLGEFYRLDNIIGKSRPMQTVFQSVKAAAGSDATILIQGESGTGKELVAGAIHYQGNRSQRSLVTVNCSALSETLLESELFGHAKGAFTGAIKDRMGRFEEANGGTIFLDEIGELSPYIQVKLLRVIQEREVERVGESKKRSIDIRVITATNKDLRELVHEGFFREDLYYRLKVFPIHVPSLKERKEDIPLLVEHFIAEQNKKTGKRITRLDKEATQVLMDYHWPGNVRELENSIEHAFVLCNSEEIGAFDLPVEIRQAEYRPFTRQSGSLQHTGNAGRHKLDKETLLKILEESDWNKAEVGRRIGLSRTAVWKYMKKWDIPLQPEEV